MIHRPIHFSTLKAMSRSPAHYLAACQPENRKATRCMAVGTIAARMLLGARPGHELALWDGQRRGKEWSAFRDAHQGVDIVTTGEAAQADEIAEAARQDPIVMELLEGARTEVPLEWEYQGFRCATSGVDILRQGLIADLKTTQTTEPERFARHAFGMLYHAQLAWYAEGARQNGIAVDRLVVLGIETTRPFAVTALEMTPALLEEGNKCIGLWLERLRVCEENDHWPAYVQQPVPWAPPDWMAPGEDEPEMDGVA